jgi:DNA polymerase delta subunit 1
MILVSPKRLRGGGDEEEEPAFEEEELFDDDLMEEVVGEQQPIPEEIEEEGEGEAVHVQESDQHRWHRPAIDPADLNNNKDLSIQWIDMDVVSGKPLEKNPNASKKKVLGGQSGSVPVLRCYGVDEEGHSVAAFIHGYTPYAFFALPAGYNLTGDTQETLGKIREALNARLQSSARGASADQELVLGVDYMPHLKSIMGYDTKHTGFLKVYVSLPTLVPTLKRVMEEGVSLPGIERVDAPGGDDMGLMPSFAPFECNVPFVLRFMVDRDITGAGWLTFGAEKYQVRQGSRKETHCQVRE